MSLLEVHSRSLVIPGARLSQGLVVEAGAPLLFTSGLTAYDAEGRPVGPADPGAQARAILTATAELCREAGGTLRDVVKLTVFLADMRAAPDVAHARAEFFPDPPFPASSMVEVTRLASSDQLVEIEAVAAIGQSSSGSNDRPDRDPCCEKRGDWR
jgi:2-iminobutanoate/2-iminopropanoate deaminase